MQSRPCLILVYCRFVPIILKWCGVHFFFFLCSSSAGNVDIEQLRTSHKRIILSLKVCLHSMVSSRGVIARGNERLSAEHPLRQ